MHCKIVHNEYQHESREFYTFIPNEPFCKLLDISPKNFIFSKTVNSEFSPIKVCCTDQNCKQLEIEETYLIS